MQREADTHHAAEMEEEMYRILKVLNNNALLVFANDTKNESILLGKGIGFGKKNGDVLTERGDAKEYQLAANPKRKVFVGTEIEIEPIYLEIAGMIIEEAEKVFDNVSSDILLPLADHIAFAARRERERMFVPNPFIPDIQVLFGREYAVAMKCRNLIKELAGYSVSDDEAGFIALHIHSGLSHEEAADTLRDTQIVDASMQLIGQLSGKKFNVNALCYTRLISHLYYMVVRTKAREKVNIELNDFMTASYPTEMEIAKKVCAHMTKLLQIPLDPQEAGYLAIHIQRLMAE